MFKSIKVFAFVLLVALPLISFASNEVLVTPVSTEAEVVSHDGWDEGFYTVSFDVFATTTNVYIPSEIKELGSPKSRKTGFVFSVDNSIASTTAKGVAVAYVSSTAQLTSKGYYVAENTTERFWAHVSYMPRESSFYRMRLESLRYNVGNRNKIHTIALEPVENFTTPYILLNAR